MSIRKSVKIHSDDDDFVFNRSTSFSDIDDLSDMDGELENLEKSAKDVIDQSERDMVKSLQLQPSKKSVPLFTIIAGLVPLVAGIVLWRSKPSYIMKIEDGKQKVNLIKLLLHILLISIVLWGIMWVISKTVTGGCSMRV